MTKTKTPHGLLLNLILQSNVILEFIENGLTEEEILVITTKFEKYKMPQINLLAYYTNLGSKLSDPKTGQKHFWTAYKKSSIRKLIPISHPLLKMAFIFLIASRKLIFSINILQINALSMIIVVFYQILYPKLMRHYPMYL